MRKLIVTIGAGCLLGAGALVAADGPETFRQRYTLDPAKAKANAALVQKDLANQKGARLAYYVVPALSSTMRLMDTYPTDGRAFGAVSWVAARDEYEPASVQFYSLGDEDAVELVAGDLTGKAGKIPASAVDFKVVKLWYQGGSAWYGYFHDLDNPKLVPELLLHDENLVRTDCATKDYYLRYDNPGVGSYWQWMSSRFEVTDYGFDNQALMMHMIHDADALRPFVLNKGEFKQVVATVHVPKGAQGGVYRGEIAVKAKSGLLAKIPMRLRVLPMDLPEPKTEYNPDKDFYLCMYGTGSREPKVLRDLAAHNAHPMGFPALTKDAADLAAQVKLAKETGISCSPLFSGVDGCGGCGGCYNLGDENSRKQYEAWKASVAEKIEIARKVIGPDVKVYSYGADEGALWTIKGERPAWRGMHEAGGLTMVTSYDYQEFLNDLDFFILPGMPVEARAEKIRKFHLAHPDGICGWYSNPHCGPESPDYFRRIHGLMAWKAGYDVSANYCWWRNNWNDMAVPYEPGMRGLVAVYGAAGAVIDTLAWEGVREGVDDIRYATLLKQIATKAAAQAKNSALQHTARLALCYVGYWDGYRGNPDAFRKECINYILKIDSLAKGGK